MVFVIESNIIWYHVHEDRKKKKIAGYQRKKETKLDVFSASFLGWAEARKGSWVPVVAVTLILE